MVTSATKKCPKCGRYSDYYEGNNDCIFKFCEKCEKELTHYYIITNMITLNERKRTYIEEINEEFPNIKTLKVEI